ncbi:LOW QUALITY PROTEIN: uncharacterized protein LOC111637795 [Centruroides sculpturatus]|uniref:LOW QUALITY PROTEIN: uncharacterized protein LOC111637795 n=1 Tax=Centruroides sculpturatus TaxID=218467 RepID=UPI000C6DFBBE|nr:LOW QUALITY PROTEIN: uncharacterized protein LOC111637795 [Centruroides sculpturatus]
MVSPSEYFSYRLSPRYDEFNPILSAGKLTQQYMVDAYVRAEANDLNWVKNNQSTLRSEKYNGLMDAIEWDEEVHGSNNLIGKAVILPSSFQGGVRNMQQYYQDAMAIVTKYGKPDLFVTMTCNPKWKEITENLKPWEKSEFRPDLVARVFHLKLKQLLDDITNRRKSLFGKVLAHVHVIEFQKRGLPHAHILIILDTDEKITTPEDIDKIVKAEIPDKETSPRLFEIVTKHMIHGPCGKRNPSSPCMVDSDCTKNFPKSCDATLGNLDEYPYYRRRNQGFVEVNGKLIDNSWVVPYNPYLLLIYNCHINVEICSSVKSVKCLYKYVYKGHDCANLCITERNERDETKEYVDSRYVSAPEAIHRIFRFKMHDQSHTIYRLPVHLQNEHIVYFQQGNEQVAAHRAQSKDTKLTGWFKLNVVDETAHDFTYSEIPKHFVWKDTTAMWERRQMGGEKVIGRMVNVSIKDPERYYLRLLLCHEKAVTSFQHLRTIVVNDESVQVGTFREAAKRKGYLLDDTIWQDTIHDAIVYAMPFQLRQMFAYICAYGLPSDALKLWNDNLQYLTEDVCYERHLKQGECQRCAEYALKDVKDTLTLSHSLCNFNLPDVGYDLSSMNQIIYDSDVEQKAADEMITSLNDDQRQAFTTIINAVNDEEIPKCFFLDGPGGSGKTYLYRSLLHYFRARNEIVIPTASTRIASNLLSGGRTYHSLFKLPLEVNETSISNLSLDSKDGRDIRLAKLLIVDECTMASSHVMNAIDRILREVTGHQISFGGKVILLGGDFRQCLNILPHAMQSAIVQSGLKYCDSWSFFKKLTLSSNMRSQDPKYSEWLLKLGNGTLGNSLQLEHTIEVPPEFLCEGDLVKEVFGEQITPDMIPTIKNRAILCPKNADVDRINDEVLKLLHEQEEKTYYSYDEIQTDDHQERLNYPIEYLNSVRASGLPPHELHLKVGTIIMLLRNLNTKRGLCNGTRLVVMSLRDHVIEAEVLTGSGSGQIILIPRTDLTNNGSDYPFTLKRRQFPVKASFAMTINKSQGQTLDRVGIFLSEPVFGHGQLYVAFSRVRRATDVKIKILKTSEQGKLIPNNNNFFTKNVVYREVYDGINDGIQNTAKEYLQSL